MCLNNDTNGIIGARFVPPIPAPSRGNINNHTNAIVSAVTKVSVLTHAGPHNEGAIPA